MAPPFESLDFLYSPAPDFPATLRFYLEGLGAELRWRIHEGDTWVAAVQLASTGPLVLLASHLEPGQGLLIYRVKSLNHSRQQLEATGWSAEGPPFELPQGPCVALRDPGGQRIAIYELTRPGVAEHFEGRIDPL